MEWMNVLIINTQDEDEDEDEGSVKKNKILHNDFYKELKYC